MELGLLAPIGPTWRYITRGGFCIELSGGSYAKVSYDFPGGKFEKYQFISIAPIGFKRYFNHPSFFSPSFGVGIISGDWRYQLNSPPNSINEKKEFAAQYLSVGFQLFSSSIVNRSYSGEGP